jgi:hypothetical protein
MSKLEFLSLCGERCIDPDLALENENLVQALKEKNFDKVLEVLDTEF